MLHIKPYIEVLKNYNFTKLWISQVCSQLTNYLLSFAVLIRTFQITSSSFAVSLILVAFGIATVVFGSLAGVYADRFDRRKLLTIINLGQAVAVLFFIPFQDNVWAMALITFIYSSLNQFYLPAEAPSIPNLVPKHQLLVANSYFSFTGSASMILGFVLAGPLSLEYGYTSVFLLGSALLVIASFATWTLPPLKPIKENTLHFLENIWAEFKEGINHFWESKPLHFPLQSLIAAQIFNGMLITIAPAFVEQVLKIKLETGTFFMIAPLGLGILLGALLLGLEDNYIKRSNLILIGFLGMGITMAAIALTAGEDSRWIYTILAVLLGYFNAHIFAPSHAILQGHVVEHVRGRIYGSLYVMLQTAATIPTVIIGLLADSFPIWLIMLFFGIVFALTGLLLRAKNPFHFARE
jgi:MFS family permease